MESDKGIRDIRKLYKIKTIVFADQETEHYNPPKATSITVYAMHHPGFIELNNSLINVKDIPHLINSLEMVYKLHNK